MSQTPPVQAKRPHVVIVGGGFGGLAALRALRKADVDITLIDRHTYNTFNPLLYQVATASLNPGDITWFLRAVRSNQKNVRFLKGIVLTIDHTTRTLGLHGGVTVAYDYLVLANGVTANFFGTPGAEQFALPLYKRSQALQVRDQLFAYLEEAAINGQDEDLRIIVVGGGPTGVETAGAFAEFRNHDMPTTYPELDRDKIHVSLVEATAGVLGPFKERLRNYARKALDERKVDLRFNTMVKEVREDGVLVEHDGVQEFLPAGLTVWATGVTAHDTVKDWNVPQGRGGRIEIDDHLRVRGLARTFAIGDIAVDPDNPLPQLAQPALQGGKYVGNLIKREVAGKSEPGPFKYFDKGIMATIGKSSAVAEVQIPFTQTAVPIKGFVAWIAWVVLHVAYLLGNRNRLATMINLGSKYLFRGSHNAIVGESPYIVAKRKMEIGVSPADSVLTEAEIEAEVAAENDEVSPL
ncbi:MAG: NAD(P)/FAD-dependent oxidoreductase [Aeromicrobium sp.]